MDDIDMAWPSPARSDSSTCSDTSLGEWSELLVPSPSEQHIPHMMSSSSYDMPTIGLPPRSPRGHNEALGPASLHSGSSSPVQPTRTTISSSSWSSRLISVQDIDEDDGDLLVLPPPSTQRKRTLVIMPKRSYDDVFDNKENVDPQLAFHNSAPTTTTIHTRRTSLVPSKPHHWKRTSTIVPVAEVPPPHKRTIQTKVPRDKDPKRAQRGSLHRRGSCDSLPDLSALKLTAVDLLSNGIKKRTTNNNHSNVAAVPRAARPEPVRRQYSMSSSVGFR